MAVRLSTIAGAEGGETRSLRWKSTVLLIGKFEGI